MASGVAGLSTLIPPFAAPPTFGGGTTAPSEGGAPQPSSQPTGINIPAARPTGEPQTTQAAEAEPSLVTLEGGQQGIYNPSKPNYLSYDATSKLGGMQDLMNLFKNIYSGIQKQNQNQINGGKTNHIDTTPLTDYTGALDMATPSTAAQPSQAEPTTGIGTGLPISEQNVYVGPATQPSQVEPTLQGQPSPIGGGGAGAGAVTQSQTATALAGGGFNSLGGIATTFGLSPNTQVNSDGTVDQKYFDPGDEGQTAFGFNSRDPNLRGVSLPVDVIQQSIGDYRHDPKVYQAIKNGQYKMAVTNPATGITKIVNVIEGGPGQMAKSHAAIDLTYRTTKDLGGTGRDQMQFQLIGPDGATMPLKGYHPGLVSNQQEPTQTQVPSEGGTEYAGLSPEGQAQAQEAYAGLPAEIQARMGAAPETAGAAAPESAATPASETAAIAAPFTEPALPEEPSPATAELFSAGADETAGEFKEGGLVEKYQTGGLVPVTPDTGIPQQPPPPPTPAAPASQAQPFIAHVEGLQEGGKVKPAGRKVSFTLDYGEEPEPGEILRFVEAATGGKVPGKGNEDKVPALLEPGEFVIKKAAVKKIGVDKLEKMNA